jgi:hypothetical protein
MALRLRYELIQEDEKMASVHIGEVHFLKLKNIVVLLVMIVKKLNLILRI